MSATFAAAALRRLDGLWPALHGVPCPADMRALVARLMAPWGETVVPATPPWRSDIGDDHSPFEYSVAFAGARPELRFLVEGQAPADLASTRRAALALHQALGALGADLTRVAALADLFLPDAAALDRPLFLLWHTVALAPGPLRAKCYLNPSIRGAAQAAPLMEEAFARLGLPAAWRTFAAAQERLGTRDIFLFCLDLEATPAARAKLYTQPPGATAADLERLAALGPRHRPGEVAEFCRAITGSTGPYHYAPGATRLPSVYFSFTGNDSIPSDITIQIPIRFYVADDGVARDRICAYLRSRGVDCAAYLRALEAVALRPLADGRGLNAWVSLRTGTEPPLVTVYFAAELYRVLPPC